ncbi:amino acid transporter [Cenococcum geophilum 1.58]|uniref:amino acid transporter n=1 Tax=Cenococcum geophilum 1.58 TaxID=794803 RepID=UPI00358F1ADE|nr:amino acid transporter [Cenococcum geophilum 1.58]
MAAFDQAHYNQAITDFEESHQRIDVSPTKKQLLGGFTVMCLVLNRTIGSGIFTAPSKILGGTGSPAAAILLWAFGGLVAMTGVLCWIELGLSVPVQTIPGYLTVSGKEEEKSVPRSGGEKNFLEFIYGHKDPKFGHPKFLITCVYGILFIVLGNLSGNAVAFGTYVMVAAGHSDPARGTVIGIAIGALTLCALLHIFSRRGGILINNIFATAKVLILMTIIILGFVKAGGGLKSKGTPAATENLNPNTSFHTNRHDVSSYANAFLYVFYTYSGFEQPFYVLSEVRNPRQVFPRYTITAMLIAITLFVLVNVSYYCVVPKEVYLNLQHPESLDMATVFFRDLFGNVGAQRAMAGLIATSIFGNLLVMTFTAARVKQEIAKEGIIPFALFFAKGSTTPWARLRARWQNRNPRPAQEAVESHLEQTPAAALGLHLFTSVFLVAITSMLNSGTAYSFLVSLYSYVIIVLLGFLVSGGLLYIKFDKRREWKTISEGNFHPWLDPLHAIIYFAGTAFFMFATFAKPAADSPFSTKYQQYAWYLTPAVGMSSLLWGVVWWCGLKGVMRYRRKDLVVKRVPYIVQDCGPDGTDNGEWVQRAELVDHEWIANVPSRSISAEDYELG